MLSYGIHPIGTSDPNGAWNGSGSSSSPIAATAGGSEAARGRISKLAFTLHRVVSNLNKTFFTTLMQLQRSESPDESTNLPAGTTNLSDNVAGSRATNVVMFSLYMHSHVLKCGHT
jgi:hypothetical protein